MSKYRFSDPDVTPSDGNMGSGKGDGCYVKTATGDVILDVFIV